MAKITVYMFHPRLETSKVNIKIWETLRQHEAIAVKDMYDLYPDFNVDVRKEQHDLAATDLIIMQHPFYWYSVPPLTKQWIDLVFEYGWAYGKNGTQLKGKKVLHVISSGGPFEAYRETGKNKYSYIEFLRPLEMSYKLCQMEFLPPYIIPGAYKIQPEELAMHAQQLEKLVHQLMHEPETVNWQGVTYLNELS